MIWARLKGFLRPETGALGAGFCLLETELPPVPEGQVSRGLPGPSAGPGDPVRAEACQTSRLW